MEHKVYFDTVHIVESLRPRDLLTGRRLFEDIRAVAASVSPPVTVQHSTVQTAAELVGLLRRIVADCQGNAHSPVLHIEAHGSPEGIQVSSGEFLAWREFKVELSKINEISNLNLIVVIAACDGINLLQIIEVTDRAPVRAIIGPNGEVGEDEIDRANLAFYGTLFKEGDAVAAWRAMNNAVAPQITFSVTTADYMLRYVFHHYLKVMCSEEALAKREDAPAERMLRERLPLDKVEHFKERFRVYAHDHPGHLDRIKKHFFLCDLYPENVARFDVTFEDCLDIGVPGAV